MGTKILFVLATVLAIGRAGQLTVLRQPGNLQFGAASSPLRASNLHNVLEASLGYTADPSHWNGLRLTGIRYGVAAVVVEVATAGAPLALPGRAYNLTEDLSLTEVFNELKDQVVRSAQRPQSFFDEEVIDRVGDATVQKSPSFLDASKARDEDFLKEVEGLPRVLEEVSRGSAAQGSGQDFVLLRLASFSRLVTWYGDSSDQVTEAKKLLLESLERAGEAADRAYPGGVLLLLAATTGRPAAAAAAAAAAPARHLLQAAPQPSSQLNLAPEFGADYPVVFNLVLFLSITLLVFVLFASLSMATMDPGRDSIIYRMTTIRMKKDN